MFTHCLKKELSHYGFEPVNLVTGAVLYRSFDFEFPGLLPLVCERVWYSDSQYKGLFGYGSHSLFDIYIQVFESESCVGVLLPYGR